MYYHLVSLLLIKSNRPHRRIPMTLEEIIYNIDIRDILQGQGIKELHPIQLKAIQDGLFFHQNFFIATPSGSGKTLIAELAIYNCLLNDLGKALYLVPFKALATEKFFDFRNLLEDYGFKVMLATSDDDSDTEDGIDFTQIDLLITTFEKADAIFRRTPTLLGDIRCIVVDEIHELGSPDRGARLEVLLMRFLLYTYNTQVIALSATVRNFTEVAGWLTQLNPTFKIIHSEDRPVPLEYRIEVAHNRMNAVKDIVATAIGERGSVLVFVGRRGETLSYAEQLSPMVHTLLTPAEKRVLKAATKKIANYKLGGLMRHGVAFHNASLPVEERRVIEELFRKRLLKVLIATSTLAAGVNTPARYVVIANIIQAHEFQLSDAAKIYNGTTYRYEDQWITPISNNLLFQMVGRAGRFGYDTRGIGIILCKDDEEKKFARHLYFEHEEEPLTPKYENLNSQLTHPDAIQDAFLLAIYQKKDASIYEIEKFFRQSFFCYQNDRTSNPKAPKVSDVLYFFGIHYSNLATMINAHHSPGHVTADCLVLESTANFVKGQVIIHGSTFFCTINSRSVLCTCQVKNQFRLVDNTPVMPHFCSHLSAFMEYVLTKPAPFQKLVENLLIMASPREFLLPYFLRHGVLTQHPQTLRYTLTPFGRLILLLYAVPTKMIGIRDIIATRQFSNIEFLLLRVCEIYKRELKYIKADPYAVCEDWMEELTMEHILKKNPGVGFADVITIKNEISRHLLQYEAIADHLGRKELTPQIKHLRLRVEYGVKAELLELMETFQPHITRNKARLLYNAGFKHSDEIFNTPINLVAQTAGIPLRSMIEILKREPVVSVFARPATDNKGPTKIIRSRQLI
jgi:replicative superfamily II helicase